MVELPKQVADFMSRGPVEEEVYGWVSFVPFYYGTRRFGIVDHVPGLFYVATVFYQFYFIPLIPLRSYIFFFGETTHGYETAVPVWLSLKSVLFAWVRMSLVASGGLFAVVSVGALLSSLQDPASIRFLYIALPTCIGCVIGMRLTRVLEKASPWRAEKLALRLGFEPESAAEIRSLVEEGAPIDRQELVPCPSCGRENATTTRVCPRCETRLR